MIDTVVVDADSIAVAAGTVEHPDQVSFAVDAKIEKIRQATQCNNIIGFVEAWKWKQNFRKHVSCSSVYKGNRGPKPQWTDNAKAYLVDKHGFSVVTYLESEDCVACTMSEIGIDKCYGAAIDKDIIYGVQGCYYNYQKDEWVSTGFEEAARFEAYQFIVGDSGDGIKGCKGVGEKGAKSLLGVVAMEGLVTEVARTYKRKEHTYGYMIEQMRLIHIRRRWDEPPYMPITEEQWEALEIIEEKAKEVLT